MLWAMCQAYPLLRGSGQRVSSTVMVQPLSRGKVPGPVISRRGEGRRHVGRRRHHQPVILPPHEEVPRQVVGGRRGGGGRQGQNLVQMDRGDLVILHLGQQSSFTARTAMGWSSAANVEAGMDTRPSVTLASWMARWAMPSSRSRSSRRWSRLAVRVEINAGLSSCKAPAPPPGAGGCGRRSGQSWNCPPHGGCPPAPGRPQCRSEEWPAGGRIRIPRTGGCL